MVNSYTSVLIQNATSQDLGGLEYLKAQIPNTIQDAITGCEKLKIEYLSVDILCLP
jgi:hypothetical protein